MIRNPEIFDLDNINNKKNNSNDFNLNIEDEENMILPNRSFSYNIQNIFMKLFLKKLSYAESDFMQLFNNTNLYLKYIEPKKFQNNSGKKIIENILDMKNQQKTYDNCFTIEYNLQKFHAQTIINKIDEKINENNNKDEKIQDIYEKLKAILNNYNQMGSEEEIESLNNYGGICESERYERKSNPMAQNYSGRKSELKKPFGRLTKTFIKGHERNKTSVLQETISGKSNFLLMGVDNSVKGVFKFYNSNGFLEFIHNFEEMLENEKINISNELYEQKINEQILEIILKDEDIFPKNNINTIQVGTSSAENSSKNDLNSKEISTEKKKKGQMSIIPENDKEEEENDINEGRETVIQKNIEGDFDFASNFMNNMKVGFHLNLEGINDKKFSEYELDKYIVVDEDIISFPNLNDDKENENSDNNNIINGKDNQLKNKSQYYLFIALALGDILENKEKSNEFIEEINNNKNIKINLKSLILNVYRLAYKYTDIKHRDFPYSSYYNFLSNLNSDELEQLKGELNINREIELNEIIENVILEKLKVEKKKKTGENISPDKKLEKSKKKKLNIFQDIVQKIEDKVSSEKRNEKELLRINPINMDELFDKNNISTRNNSEQESSSNENNISNDRQKTSEFNSLTSYVINSTSEFECKDENLGWQLIKTLAQEISSLLPKRRELYKNNQNILEEVNHHLMGNKKIFNLVGQLKFIDLGKIKLLKERMCFWLNCFNYLMLFTFFYKKWNISEEKDWKYFFRNVKYYIGGNYYSFHDMQYILYKKILFFPSLYKINENYKKFRVNKAEDSKSLEKKHPLLFNPFMIYVPIKGFLKPIIIDEFQLEKQFNQRIKDFFINFIIVDNKKNIMLPELLINYAPNFLDKEYKKFQNFIEPAVYEFIKNKKFNSSIQRNFEWKLDFDKLFDYINQDS